MRLWNVPTERMCNQHLLGEHVEMHMFSGTMKMGKSLQGYVDKKLFDYSLYLKRHDILVREMEKRGFNHKSALNTNTNFIKKYKNFRAEISTEKNLLELKRRCKNCKAL